MAQQSYDLTISAITHITAANPSTRTQIAQRQQVDLNSVDERLYFQFATLPSSLQHKKIIYARLWNDSDNSQYIKALAWAYAASVSWDKTTINWENRPGGSYGYYTSWYDTGVGYSQNFRTDATGTLYEQSVRAKAWMKNGMYVCRHPDSQNPVKIENEYYIYNSGYFDAKLTVYYDDTVDVTGQVKMKDCPTSGYINPRNAQTFKWSFEAAGSDAVCYADFAQASAVFYWRQGTSGAWTAVNASGSTAQVTIPANTFPTGQTIQYYVAGTDTEGTSSQTDVYTLSTAAGTASASCVAPINTVEDGSSPITFRWNLSSTDGQQPSRIRSSWRKASDPDDDQYWHNLFDTTTISNSYTAEAGTFPAGGIRWNIRVWNIDGTEGNRDFAEFICVAAPDPVEGLSATQVPRTTISWQSDGQEAYEISIDGEVVQRAFGADVYSWQVKKPLEDGDHVISVRIQGVYGFWSQPSTITISVANAVPAAWADVELTGIFGIDAQLTLDMHGGTMSPPIIHWYRDGERIAKVRYRDDNTGGPYLYTDRRVLGTHQYYAEIWHDNGNYARTNTVTGTMQCSTKQIALLDGTGNWLELKLSENSDGHDDFQISQQKVTQHVNGAVWPALERSTFRDRSGSYDCAFRDPAEAAAFETMFGQLVILKSRGDEVVIGMLDKLQKKVNIFYTSYKFSIDQVHTDDFTEETA